METMTWIKILTSIFDDEKIKLIDSLPDRDAILVIWFKVLCQAGKSGCGGALVLADRIPLTEEMLSTVFHRLLNTVRLALKTFQEFGMIEITEERIISVPKWEKYQQTEFLESRRELDRLRQRRHRDQVKLIGKDDLSRDSHMTVTRDMSQGGHVTVTACHASDIDKEKEKDLKDLKTRKKADLTALKTKTRTKTRTGAHAKEPVAKGDVVLESSVEKREEGISSQGTVSSDPSKVLLIQAGVTPQRAEELVQKKPEERIRVVVEYAQSHRVANLPAFIAKALEEGWRIPGKDEGDINEPKVDGDSYRRDLKTWNALPYGQRVRLLRRGGWGGNNNFPSPPWLRETLSRIEAGRAGS